MSNIVQSQDVPNLTAFRMKSYRMGAGRSPIHTLIMTAWVHPDFFPCRHLFLQPILFDSVPQRSGRIYHSIQSSYSIEISMD